MNDANLLLSGAGGAVQDLGTVTSAGTHSTDWVDLQVNTSLGDGTPLFCKVHVSTEAIASATLDATLECQLVTYPVVATDVARMVNCDAAATGGIVTLDASVASHGLERGQRLSVAVAGSSGLSTSADYWIRDVLSTTTFTLAASPDKDAAIVTLVNTTNDLDLVIEPNIVGSTGTLPILGYHDESLTAFAMNPGARTDNPVGGRYLYVRFLPSATITTGKVLVYLGTDPGHRRIYHPRGSSMPVWNP